MFEITSLTDRFRVPYSRRRRHHQLQGLGAIGPFLLLNLVRSSLHWSPRRLCPCGYITKPV